MEAMGVCEQRRPVVLRAGYLFLPPPFNLNATLHSRRESQNDKQHFNKIKVKPLNN
jgi:hypothetical protein